MIIPTNIKVSIPATLFDSVPPSGAESVTIYYEFVDVVVALGGVGAVPGQSVSSFAGI